jgi:cytochrome c oxidase subunit IV
MSTAEETREPGTKFYLIVWAALLLIVALEVILTYQHLAPGTLLASLLVLAFVEATLGVMYFMHMRYEKSVLFWSLVPYLLMCFFMLNHIWRDAARVISMKVRSP